MDRSSQLLRHILGQFFLIWGFFVQSSNLLPSVLIDQHTFFIIPVRFYKSFCLLMQMKTYKSLLAFIKGQFRKLDSPPLVKLLSTHLKSSFLRDINWCYCLFKYGLLTSDNLSSNSSFSFLAITGWAGNRSSSSSESFSRSYNSNESFAS